MRACAYVAYWGPYRAELPHCAKFHQIPSNDLRDIVIFRIFKMAAAAILDFESSQTFLANGFRKPSCITPPHFVKIVRSIVEINDFSIFQDGGRPPIVDLFGAYLDHPQMVLGGLYQCAKFGCDRCSWLSFDNMKGTIFGVFGLKTPILFTPQK